MNQTAQKKVAFYTLGCKLNFSETSTIARLFEKEGIERVDWEEDADIYVLNTCSVTDNADKKCKYLIQRLMHRSPQAYVAVVGCYAQLKPENIATIPGVDLVLGASEKFNILQHIQSTEKGLKTNVHACEIETVNEFVPSYSSNDRTRTFFKIQDGCDYSCSFCTIPLARGASRSASINETVKAINNMAKSDSIKEVVLTGVNTGDFGRHNGESFYGLIQQLDLIEGIERFRISSIEPNLLSDEIIEFVAQSKKFVPHFHIPLQSGSDTVLRMMRRRYKTELYVQRVEKIKSLMPNACIGVDVIVGFPGETDELFQETFDFIHSLPVSYLHVFTYSERDNTHAIQLDDRVPSSKRAERSKRLHLLSDKKKHQFYFENSGCTYPVLLEAEQNGDFMYGFTSNYIKTKVPYDASKINKIVDLTLDFIDSDGIFIAKEKELIAL